MVVQILSFVAILACTLFAGAAVYITFVEHPARLSCGIEIAARQWAPSYKRATVMQASLAVVATVAGSAVWAQTGEPMWLAGSMAIFAVVPVTLLVILPTNRRLLATGRDLASEETGALLTRWGHLHAIRSALSVAAAIMLISAAIG